VASGDCVGYRLHVSQNVNGKAGGVDVRVHAVIFSWHAELSMQLGVV
jgi:hypothetical protein